MRVRPETQLTDLSWYEVRGRDRNLRIVPLSKKQSVHVKETQ